MRFLLNWLLTSISIAIATFIVPGIAPFGPTDAWLSFAFVGLFLGLVNSLVKPLVTVISLPVTFLTLGVFQLVVNSFMLELASWLSVNLLGSGISISGFWSAFVGAIIVSIMCSILGVATKDASRRRAMENQTVHVERYTLTTALCMIVGICIGSGIFFKSDNILIATGGNVALGVAMFLLAATTIVFGGLTLARFASRTDGAGGPIAYAERFLGPHRLTFVGWHFTFLYLPMVTAIICWVVGVYACMTFGLAGTFAQQMAIGVVFLLACCVWNVCWPTLGGYVQNITTVAKVAPLVVVLVVGLIFGQPAQHIVHGIETAGAAGTGWIAAAAPIAFAFDGWSAAASIAPELKNAKRNLPLALTIGPAIILVLYVGYFLGVSCTLGPQTVMAAGDASLSMLFVELIGEGAAPCPTLSR